MTTIEIPRVETAKVVGPATLRIKWQGARHADEVNLIGWIATGGKMFEPLRNPINFHRAAIVGRGSAIAWDEDRDLAIDALHLKKLADEQRPFEADDLRTWQIQLKLSNSEAAALIHVSLSTYNAYKAGGDIPRPICMLVRAIERDPLLMQAHYRPRMSGRPRKAVAAP
jgi:hypothetical protein